MHTAMHAHIYIHPACPSSGPASSSSGSSKLVAPVVSVASSLFGIMEIFSQPKKPVEHPGRGPSLLFFFFFFSPSRTLFVLYSRSCMRLSIHNLPYYDFTGRFSCRVAILCHFLSPLDRRNHSQAGQARALKPI